MKITVCDLSPSLAAAWPATSLEITALTGSILEIPCDAVVSPANSFGFMDGGVDYAYSRRFGWGVQERLQNEIRRLPFGELLVGQALLVATNDQDIRYVISAPTMRVPRRILDPMDVYLASRAAIKCAVDAGLDHIAFPGMGTGCGDLSFDVAARAMALGIEAGYRGEEFPGSWQQAQAKHFGVAQ